MINHLLVLFLFLFLLFLDILRKYTTHRQSSSRKRDTHLRRSACRKRETERKCMRVLDMRAAISFRVLYLPPYVGCSMRTITQKATRHVYTRTGCVCFMQCMFHSHGPPRSAQGKKNTEMEINNRDKSQKRPSIILLGDFVSSFTTACTQCGWISNSTPILSPPSASTIRNATR